MYVLYNSNGNVIGVFDGTEEELKKFLEEDSKGWIVDKYYYITPNKIDPYL